MKKRPISTVALTLLLPLCLFWQQATATTSLAELDDIYQKLITAIGDRTSEFPQLRVVSTAEMVAGYSKLSNSIVIEQKAIQVCETLGNRKTSAIAFLLAHELTHFYQKHSWEETNFGFLLTKERFINDLEQEREADTYGAFILHLAGYTINVIPDLIPELYNAYGLMGQKLEGYPSLSERQAVANEVCHKVGNLIHIFETANYLYASGQLGQAAMSYEYLLNFVQCKELYANLGAACVAAAATPSAGQQMFIYPLSLDSKLPIRNVTDIERKELIQKAIQSLKKAVTYDPTNYPAFINLACAYDLAQDYTAATKLLNQLQPLAKKADQQTEIQILRGIIAAHQGQQETAATFFKTAKTAKTTNSIQAIAEQNENILQGKTAQATIANKRGFAEANSIDGMDLKYEPDIRFDETVVLRSTAMETYQLSWKNLPASSITLYKGSRQLALQRVTKASEKTRAGIHIGSTGTQVKTAYGEPDSYVLRSTGSTLVYFDKKVLFTLNAADVVTEWGVFALY